MVEAGFALTSGEAVVERSIRQTTKRRSSTRPMRLGCPNQSCAEVRAESMSTEHRKRPSSGR